MAREIEPGGPGPRRLVADEPEPAMEQLVEILERDAEFDQGSACFGLLAIFDLLGELDDRIRPYQRRMQAALA
jgi:thioredoxin-like negative regulator of GroEL